jgi:RimJ/RimL family protein N-acetyltransferase
VGSWRNELDPEIGWWLARRYWGRGLATEAARRALRDGFERVRLDRIVSIARPANTASTRIMKKLGLSLECDFESDGVQLVRYAINRAQYSIGRTST